MQIGFNNVPSLGQIILLHVIVIYEFLFKIDLILSAITFSSNFISASDVLETRRSITLTFLIEFRNKNKENFDVRIQ